eukprot:sb/3469298/
MVLYRTLLRTEYQIFGYEITPGKGGVTSLPTLTKVEISCDIVTTLKEAMVHWEEETCISFVERTHESDYLSFHNGVKWSFRDYFSACTVYGGAIPHLTVRSDGVAAPDSACMSPYQDDIYRGEPGRRKRAVSSEPAKLWIDGVIPYTIEDGIPGDIVTTLKEAMVHWEEETCISFVERTHESDYLSFHNGVKFRDYFSACTAYGGATPHLTVRSDGVAAPDSACMSPFVPGFS